MTVSNELSYRYTYMYTYVHGDYRLSIDRFFVGFNAICYAFLRNNHIYIEGSNCSFSTVPVLFNKWSGLRPSDTLSSWWLGWRRHARLGKPFFSKSLDLSFQSFTIVVLTIYLYWSALRPLTSLETSAWRYRVTTQYSYYPLCSKQLRQWQSDYTIGHFPAQIYCRVGN